MTRPITRRAASRRIKLLVLAVMVMFALLLLRAAYLGTIRSGWLDARADNQHLSRVVDTAERGSIMSSDGQLLAMDQPSVEVTADGRYVEDALRTTDQLVSVLGGTPQRRDELLGALAAKRPWIVVARNATLREAEQLKAMKIQGVNYRRTTKRIYPLGATAGQVLGFTNLESRTGTEGLEKRLDRFLAGSDGGYTEVRDLRLGQTVRIMNKRDSVPGKSVELTINADIQRELERRLVQARTKYKAKGATGVVMDPNTGRILAMASVPLMNANNRATLDVNASQVRPITDPYEPGSVFKVVTVAGALQEKLTTPATMYSVPPRLPFQYQGRTRYVNEAHKRTETKDMTTTEILQESSNVGTILISQQLGKRDKLRLWMARFGFGQQTGIDLDHESIGDLPGGKWDDGQRMNIPFGQGMSATTIQLVRVYAAIANGGMLVTPHVVSKIDGRASAVAAPKRVISTRTAAQLTGMMRKVVEGEDGTGVTAQITNYQVAGKTGTGEKVQNGRYVNRYRASFIGFVPANDPQLVIAIMIDDPDPRGPYTGGEVAAPVFKDVGNAALSTLGIAP